MLEMIQSGDISHQSFPSHLPRLTFSLPQLFQEWENVSMHYGWCFLRDQWADLTSHHISSWVTFTPHMAPLRESPWEAGPASGSTGSTVIWGWKYVLLSTRSCAPWTFLVDLGGLDGWSPGGEQLWPWWHWNEALKKSTFTSPLATPEEIAAGMCASDGPPWMLQMNPWPSSWRGKICCCAPGLGGLL